MNTHISSQQSAPVFRLDGGYWSVVPGGHFHLLVINAIARAKLVLKEHEIDLPHKASLQAIAMAAEEATILLHSVCTAEPSKGELEAFFAHFVIQAAARGYSQ